MIRFIYYSYQSYSLICHFATTIVDSSKKAILHHQNNINHIIKSIWIRIVSIWNSFLSLLQPHVQRLLHNRNKKQIKTKKYSDIKVLNEFQFRHGLFRGLVPPLISLTFLNSLSFGCYSLFKGKIQQLRTEYDIMTWCLTLTRCRFLPDSRQGKFNPDYFLAGFLTGTLSGIFSTPFEMVSIYRVVVCRFLYKIT